MSAPRVRCETATPPMSQIRGKICRGFHCASAFALCASAYALRASADSNPSVARIASEGGPADLVRSAIARIASDGGQSGLLAEPDQPALMLAARITFAHFSVSSARNLP